MAIVPYIKSTSASSTKLLSIAYTDSASRILGGGEVENSKVADRLRVDPNLNDRIRFGVLWIFGVGLVLEIIFIEIFNKNLTKSPSN